MTPFATQLRLLRKEKGMTQEQLSVVLHVTRQTISNWENDRAQPDYEMLSTIASVFGVQPSVLLGEETAHASPPPSPPPTQQEEPPLSFPAADCVFDLPAQEDEVQQEEKKRRLRFPVWMVSAALMVGLICSLASAFFPEKTPGAFAIETFTAKAQPVQGGAHLHIYTRENSARYPVIVLNHGPQEEYTLVIETYPQTNTDQSAYYELYLIDENGAHVSFPGKTRMKLLIPFPDGYTQEELDMLDFAVTHYDSRHDEKEKFDKNSITVRENGILIEIFDLSPFLVSWEKAEPTPAPTATPAPDTGDLPQTGDSSHFLFFVLLCGVSIAAIALLRRKQNNA